jgi:alkylhydroperoxidase family enzyme
VDAHSAMVMAQGYTQEEVAGILSDIDGAILSDDKTKTVPHFAEKITKNAYKTTSEDIKALAAAGCSEEEIFETVAVTSLFNYMDRMADALGAPVEGFQQMVAEMMKDQAD